MKNILFDGKYYYLIRSLNDGNMQDLRRGIEDIRTDAERFKERTGDYGKYNNESVCSLEEVFDHIKMRYRKDTNCTSLTRSANVALTYHVDNSKYVLVKVAPDELDKYFDAGDYMLHQIEDEITKAGENLAEEVRDLLDKIDRAQIQDEIKTLLSVYNENITQESIRQKQYLTDEEQERVDKTIAKLKILENNGVMSELVPGTNNSFVVATMGNAYSSSEYISYGTIPREKVVNCPKFFLDVFSLVQQVEDSGKYPKEIMKICAKLIESVAEGYDVVTREGQAIYTNGEHEILLEDEAQFVVSDHSSEEVLNKPLGVEEVYNITDGRMSYNSVTMQALALRTLSEMKLKKESIISVLEKVMPEENIQEIFKDTFCLNPAFIVRQNGRGYKVSETVNILINKNGNDLSNKTTQNIISTLDTLSKETLIQIVQGTLPQEQLISLMEQEENINVTDRYLEKFGDYLDKQQGYYHSQKSKIEKYIIESILEGIDWQDFGRKLTKKEKNKVIQKVLPEAKNLKKNNIVNLYKTLTNLGLSDSKIFSTIVNIAVDGKIERYTYKQLLMLNQEEQEQILSKNVGCLKTRLEPIDIDLLTKRGKTIAKLQNKARNLKVDESLIQDTDIRNIYSAIQLMDRYNFEEAIGRKITEDEEKALLQSLIKNKKLSKRRLSYISTLQDKLMGIGLTEQESYGAIINYAVGTGREAYAYALDGTIKYNELNKEDIIVDVTNASIKRALLNNEMKTNENARRIDAIGIDASGVDSRNIDTAIEIIDEYNFEEAIGRKITEDEEKAVLQLLIGAKVLNKNKPRYISTLQDKLMEIGLTEQESYGAILNYAVGTGRGGYTEALRGAIKFSELNKEDIIVDVTNASINRALLNTGMKTNENIRRLDAIGIDASEVDSRNIDKAIEIIDGYNFEEAIGRKITEDEEKVLLQSLIGGKLLSKNRYNFISTLQDKLMEIGLTEQESYGAILNYAVGTGRESYTEALRRTIKFSELTKEGIIVDVTNASIKQALLNNGIEIFENTKRLEAMGIDASGVDSRNIDKAIKIIDEYNFEEAMGRKITEDEEKALLQSLIGNKLLSKNRRTYISTLQDKLKRIGLTEQESYGAILNYAVGTGRGSYTEALCRAMKYNVASNEEIVVNVTEESISKAVIKQEKKALKLARQSVNKESVAKIEETLEKLDTLSISKEDKLEQYT